MKTWHVVTVAAALAVRVLTIVGALVLLLVATDRQAGGQCAALLAEAGGRLSGWF